VSQLNGGVPRLHILGCSREFSHQGCHPAPHCCRCYCYSIKQTVACVTLSTAARGPT